MGRPVSLYASLARIGATLVIFDSDHFKLNDSTEELQKHRDQADSLMKERTFSEAEEAEQAKKIKKLAKLELAALKKQELNSLNSS